MDENFLQQIGNRVTFNTPLDTFASSSIFGYIICNANSLNPNLIGQSVLAKSKIYLVMVATFAIVLLFAGVTKESRKSNSKLFLSLLTFIGTFYVTTASFFGYENFEELKFYISPRLVAKYLKNFTNLRIILSLIISSIIFVYLQKIFLAIICFLLLVLIFFILGIFAASFETGYEEIAMGIIFILWVFSLKLLHRHFCKIRKFTNAFWISALCSSNLIIALNHLYFDTGAVKATYKLASFAFTSSEDLARLNQLYLREHYFTSFCSTPLLFLIFLCLQYFGL